MKQADDNLVTLNVTPDFVGLVHRALLDGLNVQAHSAQRTGRRPSHLRPALANANPWEVRDDQSRHSTFAGHWACVLLQSKEDEMQTAKKIVVPFAGREALPQRPQAAPRVAADVSVIHWACFGMREVQTDDGLLGLERLAQRIQDDIEAIAEEVRS
jgi:hypothetical protein